MATSSALRSVAIEYYLKRYRFRYPLTDNHFVHVSNAQIKLLLLWRHWVHFRIPYSLHINYRGLVESQDTIRKHVQLCQQFLSSLPRTGRRVENLSLTFTFNMPPLPIFNSVWNALLESAATAGCTNLVLQHLGSEVHEQFPHEPLMILPTFLPEPPPALHTPSLTVFELNVTLLRDRSGILWVLSVLNQAPIESLTLHGQGLGPDAWQGLLSRAVLPHLLNLQLTSNMIPIDALLDFLHGHTAIEALWIGALMEPRYAGQWPARLTLPSLVSLRAPALTLAGLLAFHIHPPPLLCELHLENASVPTGADFERITLGLAPCHSLSIMTLFADDDLDDIIASVLGNQTAELWAQIQTFYIYLRSFDNPHFRSLVLWLSSISQLGVLEQLTLQESEETCTPSLFDELKRMIFCKRFMITSGSSSFYHVTSD